LNCSKLEHQALVETLYAQAWSSNFSACKDGSQVLAYSIQPPVAQTHLLAVDELFISVNALPKDYSVAW
jgi:hypothetical protein